MNLGFIKKINWPNSASSDGTLVSRRNGECLGVAWIGWERGEKSGEWSGECDKTDSDEKNKGRGGIGSNILGRRGDVEVPVPCSPRFSRCVGSGRRFSLEETNFIPTSAKHFNLHLRRSDSNHLHTFPNLLEKHSHRADRWLLRHLNTCTQNFYKNTTVKWQLCQNWKDITESSSK